MRLIQKLSGLAISKKDTLVTLMITLGVLGTIQILAGGIWDASSHAIKAPEFFWSIQHIAVYIGVSMVACSSIVGFLLLRQGHMKGTLKKATYLIIIGALVQIASGYADSVSHDVYGIDGLLSWSHQPLEAGLLMGALGAFFAIQSIPDQKLRVLRPLAIITVLFSAMWLGFNAVLFFGGYILCIPVYEIFSSGCAVL